MKRFLCCLLLSLAACTDVPAGHVGIKVFLLGGEKGVDHEVKGVGRYWIGVNEQLFLFPTFEQNPKYTQADDKDSGREVEFQTIEGMTCDADFSITYTITPDRASTVFQKYRLGVDEINKGPLRNILRDALSEVTSTLPVESVYGEGKTTMIDTVQKLVTQRAALSGITVSQVSLLGSIRLPPTVVAALNSKIEATQRAQQRENELREAEAEAKKQVAQAQGEASKQRALSEGKASSISTESAAQARANRVLAESLTRELIEYEKLKKWDGRLPQVTSGAMPMFTLTKD